MYLVIATVEENDYFYGPYLSRQDAQAVIDRAEERKGNRCPEMKIRALQSSDAFLLGSASTSYVTTADGTVNRREFVS